jgi:hypothetical protein
VTHHWVSPWQDDFISSGFRFFSLANSKKNGIVLTVAVDKSVRKNFMPDLTLFKDSTPERLIAGIVAGLTFWVRREIVLVELEGSAYVPVIFSGCWLW